MQAGANTEKTEGTRSSARKGRRTRRLTGSMGPSFQRIRTPASMRDEKKSGVGMKGTAAYSGAQDDGTSVRINRQPPSLERQKIMLRRSRGSVNPVSTGQGSRGYGDRRTDLRQGYRGPTLACRFSMYIAIGWSGGCWLPRVFQKDVTENR